MSKKRQSKRTSTPARSSRAKANTQSARQSLTVATNERRSVPERVQAMSTASLAVCEDDAQLQAMLAVLRNSDEASKVRLAALASIQAASFSVVAFGSCRSDYIAALRELIDDPDLELRQRVLGILAREKDRVAQRRLLEGLEKPDRALLSAEKALQLLGYDPHVDVYRVARRIVEDPPSQVARREALRLLAADSASQPMFEKILRDKSEGKAYRQIAAGALHTIAPDALQAHAREIVADASEWDDIKATSLTALSQFGDGEQFTADSTLLKQVSRLQAATSGPVKQTAKRFLTKYRK